MVASWGRFGWLLHDFNNEPFVRDLNPYACADADSSRLTNDEIMRVCVACDMSGANLQGHDLHGIRLQGTNLRRADLRNANLCGTDLRGANLRGASLQGVILDHDTNFAGAKADSRVFAGTDLAALRRAYLPPCLQTGAA